MQMKFSFLISMPFLCFLAGCVDINSIGFAGKKGSGISETKEIELEPFHSIQHRCVGQVTLKIGEPQNVKVTFDDNLLELVELSVKNGELMIETKGSHSTNLGLDVEITAPTIEELKISSVGSLHASGFDQERLELAIAGVGGLIAEGRVTNLDVGLTGVGSADLKSLKSESAVVKVSGVGNAVLSVSQTLDARLTGVGSLTVFGKPKTNESTSGIGKITMVDE